MATSTPLPNFNEPPRQSTNWLLWGLLAGGLVVLGIAGLALTTTFTKPQVLRITLPTKRPATTSEVPAAGTLTIILGKNRQLYYYLGPNTVARPAALHRAAAGQAMRKVLLDWQQQYKSVVYIKSAPDSDYQSMVDMLDEMNIINQKKYTLLSLTPADQQLLAATKR